MKYILQTTILSLLAVFLLVMFSFGYSRAAQTGSYLSEPIGDNDVQKFLSFEVIEQLTNAGSIAYSFSSSADQYQKYSAPQTINGTNGKIDLANIPEIQGSKFIKVKIVLTLGNNAPQSPSLKGYKVSFEKTGGAVVTQEGKLVSTGASLWFNILVGLVITGVIAYFLFRRKPEGK